MGEPNIMDRKNVINYIEGWFSKLNKVNIFPS